MKKYSVLTVLLIIVVVLGGYFYFRNNSVKQDRNLLEPVSRSQETLSEYSDEQYGFSLFYPDGMTVKEFDEGGGAATITFEDAVNGSGFQIFILPYAESQVSEERFLLDVPSGVRNNPVDIQVDGVMATSFSSTNASLGDTWEVWFIHEGFLYELTTLKPLENLLDKIVQTWKFLDQ